MAPRTCHPSSPMPLDLEQLLGAVCRMHAATFDLTCQDFSVTGIFGIAYARFSLSVGCLALYLAGRARRAKGRIRSDQISGH